MFYSPVDAVNGEHYILWELSNDKTLITGVVLAAKNNQKIKGRKKKSNPDIDKVKGVINDKRSVRTIDWVFKHCDFKGCTDWQVSIWKCLATEVKSGKIISYGGLAEKLGRPGAARSVGSTMAKNRYPLIIPCHRVVGSKGSLGGFMNGRKDGLSVKKQLLAAENVHYVGNSLKTEGALIA